MSPGSLIRVIAGTNPSRLANEKFKFDHSEFGKHIAYKQIELDNGAVLTAPVEKFEECFKTTKKQDAHTFSTTGTIVDERLRTTK